MKNISIEWSKFMPNLYLVKNQPSLMFGISTIIAVAITVGGILAPRLQAQESKEDVKQDIRISLNDLNDVSEWVRLERAGSQVKLTHTVVAPNGVAKVVSALAPVPTLEHSWYDHPTSRIVFVPDTCSKSSTADCSVAGTDIVTLPKGVNVDQGKFTLEYTESKLVRTVTFRVPAQKS
jgi:hypothetical protein